MALVPVKSVLSGAYVTYLGGENETTREKTLNKWSQAMRLDSYNIRTFLATEA